MIRCLWAYGESGGREIDANNKFLNRGKQGVKELAEPGCKEEVLMAGGSDSYHTPLAKAKYENALPNIYSWCQFGKDKPNFIGIFAVQWSGNQHDLWLPDDLTVAEYEEQVNAYVVKPLVELNEPSSPDCFVKIARMSDEERQGLWRVMESILASAESGDLMRLIDREKILDALDIPTVEDIANIITQENTGRTENA